MLDCITVSGVDILNIFIVVVAEVTNCLATVAAFVTCFYLAKAESWRIPYVWVS